MAALGRRDEKEEEEDMKALTKFLQFLREFWSFLRVRKKYWLFPAIVVLLVIGGMIVLSQGSVVAPLVYPLF